MTAPNPKMEFDYTAKMLLKVICGAISIFIILGLLLLFVSCSALPQFFQAADDIITDEAIVVEVDKAAIQKQNDISITVNLKNKEQ